MIVLSSYAGIYAQTKDTVVIRKFTQKDGLSSYNIRQITQDQWGFMWISTQGGVSRFDGRAFVNYTKNAVPERSLCGIDARGMIEDSSRHLLWVLPGEIGLNAISSVTGEVTSTIAIPGMGNEDWNVTMLMAKNELWIGTSIGVRVFDPSMRVFRKSPPLPANRNPSTEFTVRLITKDKYNNIWVCYAGYGIVIYHGETKKIIRKIKLTELNDHRQSGEIRFFQSVELRPGEMLFASSQGLRRIRYTAGYEVQVDNHPCASMPVLNELKTNWVAADGENTMLVAAANGLFRFNHNLTTYQSIEELPRVQEASWLTSVQSFYRDREGNLWLGCKEGLGYVAGKKSPFKAYCYDPQTHIVLDQVSAVYPVENKTLLVGIEKGFVEINGTNGRYSLHDSTHKYQYIFQDRHKRVILSGSNGLSIYHAGRIFPITEFYSEFQPFGSYSINSQLYINDTLTILGTDNNKGILLWNPVHKRIRSINAESGSPRLNSNIVNNLFRDRQARIWVLSDNIITILSPDLRSAAKLVLREKSTTNSYNLFFDMCEANGSYWIASYGSGVLQLGMDSDIKRVISARTGLSDNGVYQLYALPGNHLLVTSNNGLSKIDLASGKVSRYYVADGLHANAFEEVCGVLKDGKIYAGGVNGFTVIDPQSFSANTVPPKLYFTGVEMKTTSGRSSDTSNLQLKTVTIPNNVLQTTIRFVGLNYSNSERTEYAYRIVEEGERWIGNGTQSNLSLIRHTPGRYTLLVKAVNEDGVWSEPVVLRLFFEPKWYQTKWFWAGILLVLVFAFYQFYLFRIRQFQREEKIRRRLASDLHDDLGSTMNSINTYANLALMDDDDNRYLVNIKQGAQEAMAAIRDIIWILNDGSDTIAELADRIYKFAQPLCEAKKVCFEMNIDEELKAMALAKEEKRNLHMVIKEAVNNSLKYAEAKQILVCFHLENQKKIVRIRDDGNGFNQSLITSGNGLSNMQRRAGEIGYYIRISSEEGHGTDIFLQKH